MKRENASLKLARQLFTDEEFVVKEAGVWCAKSRLSGGHKEQAKLCREISDIRVLTNRNSVVVFLPDYEADAHESDRHNLCADAVIDGVVVELKNISGNRETLGKAFRRGYKQGRTLLKNHKITAEHSVFLRICSPLSIKSVRAKIDGELKSSIDKGGCICYFETTNELCFWSYDELRGIIGT